MRNNIHATRMNKARQIGIGMALVLCALGIMLEHSTAYAQTVFPNTQTISCQFHEDHEGILNILNGYRSYDNFCIANGFTYGWPHGSPLFAEAGSWSVYSDATNSIKAPDDDRYPTLYTHEMLCTNSYERLPNDLCTK